MGSEFGCVRHLPQFPVFLDMRLYYVATDFPSSFTWKRLGHPLFPRVGRRGKSSVFYLFALNKATTTSLTVMTLAPRIPTHALVGLHP